MVAAYALEKTKAYHKILLLGVCACVGAGILFVMMLFSNNYWPLVVSFGLLGELSKLCANYVSLNTCVMRILGVSVLPLLPVMMENCAEVTYPVSEDVSMGLMFVGMKWCCCTSCCRRCNLWCMLQEAIFWVLP